MSDPHSVQAKKDAAAAGAADIEAGSDPIVDPVTGRDDHPTGAAQAAENIKRDPVS